MGEDGNTTNPTKSPSDPYVFNTVLTRSKSLVVVVGNPMALLNIERHMVKTYGKKARCWSSFIRLCLEQNSFLVPPEVERDQLKRSEFELRLKAKLFDSDRNVSSMYSHLANLIALKQQQALPSHASAPANCLNPSPAKQTFADASASSPAKSTSKPPQKSAVPTPGQVPKHAKQQQQNPPVTARKQPTARPALKQPLQGSSKTAGIVLRQEQPKHYSFVVSLIGNMSMNMVSMHKGRLIQKNKRSLASLLGMIQSITIIGGDVTESLILLVIFILKIPWFEARLK